MIGRVSETVDEDLHGYVRSVRVEKAKVRKQRNVYKEDPRKLIRVMTFDEEGRRMEKMHFDPHSSVASKTFFMYDAEGRLVETTQHNNEMLTKKTLFAYEATGKVKEEVSQDVDGKLLNKVVYGYDAKGNRVESAYYRAGGSFLNKQVASYDDWGRIIEVAFCRGSQQGGILVRRDGKRAVLMPVDKLATQVGICGDGFLMSKVVFTYDKESETGTLQYSGDGILVSRTVLVRDVTDGRIEIAKYDASGILQSKEEHRREFDSRGNWVKSANSLWDVKTGAFEPVELTYRTISYWGFR